MFDLILPHVIEDKGFESRVEKYYCCPFLNIVVQNQHPTLRGGL